MSLLKDEVGTRLHEGEARALCSCVCLVLVSFSRSHSVFMVTIHTKENSVDGEELLKTGKLNLVRSSGSCYFSLYHCVCACVYIFEVLVLIFICSASKIKLS